MLCYRNMLIEEGDMNVYVFICILLSSRVSGCVAYVGSVLEPRGYRRDGSTAAANYATRYGYHNSNRPTPLIYY